MRDRPGPGVLTHSADRDREKLGDLLRFGQSIGHAIFRRLGAFEFERFVMESFNRTARGDREQP